MEEKFPKLIIHLGPCCYQYSILYNDGKSERTSAPELIERLGALAGYSIERSGDGSKDISEELQNCTK
jgi:hypothetical protein